MTDTPMVERLARVAEIMGPSSAAARALAEYYDRNAAGEEVRIYQFRNTLIVGPAMIDAALEGK